MADTRVLVVEATGHGQRLDKWLASQWPDHSRSYIQKLINDGQVQLNGATIANPAAKVKSGESYQIHIPDPVPLDLTPVAMPLDIVFEDEHLLVVNKPAGLTVHPAPGNYTHTLVHGLLAYCGDSLSGIGGTARPGIVHRLDKDTSGLMVVAKHDRAHRHLSAQLKDRSLSRDYKAIVWGVPTPMEGIVDAPIARSPQNRKKMGVVAGGKEARTRYRVEEVFSIRDGHHVIPIASLVHCQLETGRTHQIRVHMTHIGHPLLGDPLYGSSKRSYLQQFRGILNEETIHFLNDSRRQALHACKLALRHPDHNGKLMFEMSYPEDLVTLLTCLKDLQKIQ